MKPKIILSSLLLIQMLSTFGQKSSITLTFTAIDSAAYVHLDSIKVMNRTQGGDTVIYWPDTTLTYQITPSDLMLYIGYATGIPVGVGEIGQEKKQFHLYQNYPNPVKDQSLFSLYMQERGTVNITVTDINGKVIITQSKQLDQGNHSFRITPGNSSLYFLTARWNGISRSIKILTTGSNSTSACTLDYFGLDTLTNSLKDGYSIKSLARMESGILDTTNNSKNYIFQFATNIPCLGTPTVTYEGQVYNTIQIYSQCWFKENLNVGVMINSSIPQTNNNIKEKYCYYDNLENCSNYGGLYQWNELMQYTTQPGTQGLCPTGWHLPLDEEWKVLEGAVDSHYGIGDPIWDLDLFRGFDAGFRLKSDSNWCYSGNGANLFGFSGKPGGLCTGAGGFLNRCQYGIWYTSNEASTWDAWDHSLESIELRIDRDAANEKGIAFSARCIRNY
jgi:uncharacterized protein (TIGR02145 family)